MSHVARSTPRVTALAGRLLVVTLTLAAVGCGGAATPPDEAALRRDRAGALAVPASEPAIRGTVTRVSPGDSVLPTASAGDPDAPVSCPPACAPSRTPLRTVLIEETPGPIGGAKIVLTMPTSARVLRRTEAGVAVAAFADLRVGQRVSAWVDGPVAESYPGQARGSAIVIER